MTPWPVKRRRAAGVASMHDQADARGDGGGDARCLRRVRDGGRGPGVERAEAGSRVSRRRALPRDPSVRQGAGRERGLQLRQRLPRRGALAERQAARRPPAGRLELAKVMPDGSIVAKLGWWRAVEGQLGIEGKRVDASAPPLRADVPGGYGSTGFQAAGLTFPTGGCWRVVGSIGRASLTFVELVRSALTRSRRPPRAASRRRGSRR